MEGKAPHRFRLLGVAAIAVGLIAACTSAQPPSNVSSVPTQQAVATAAVPVALTASAAAPVRVSNAQLDSNDAAITVQNTSTQVVDLGGWSLLVGNERTQLPQALNVQPNQSVTLHTAAGTDSGTDVYLGQSAAPLVNQLEPGATIALENPSGGTVSSFVVPGSSG